MPLIKNEKTSDNPRDYLISSIRWKESMHMRIVNSLRKTESKENWQRPPIINGGINTLGELLDTLKTNPRLLKLISNFGKGCEKEVLLCLKHYFPKENILNNTKTSGFIEFNRGNE